MMRERERKIMRERFWELKMEQWVWKKRGALIAREQLAGLTRI